ncbi:ABC transporter ATP-binding protein [uncultured Ferrovibrio sp.]|jgi:branched-chain amino acid transport system ATP-binding protein|uniref:ABC transporter ATP-binding protein n=1 Tax=uncultured Ferrovibrio sp. TaxID=1576913 RepID=UPI002620C9EA|nr:ABC transporter ATP-binding protein [uncultured Ferrovibrio sp.]
MMLELKAISAGYGRINALSGVSLKVDTGRIVALLGANGAGKTTTLNCISRVVPLTSGEIHFEGRRVDRLASEEMVALGVCQVPEGREIFARMSVRENLEIGAHLRRDKAAIRQDFDRVCEYFPRLRQRFTQEAGTLSGGEQQMLLIARALMGRPKLLLLDEPSLGLSPLLVEQIFAIIRQLNKEGLTILLVEQNARIALNVSDYAYILENGEIAFEGNSADLVQDDRVRQAYLGA